MMRSSSFLSVCVFVVLALAARSGDATHHGQKQRGVLVETTITPPLSPVGASSTKEERFQKRDKRTHMMVSKLGEETLPPSPPAAAASFFDKRIIGPFSRYYYYYYYRHHREDDDDEEEDNKKKNAFAGSSTTTSSLIELSACECYFAPYENRDAAKRNVETAVGVGLRCDKEGYFIVGFENAGQYAGGEKENRYVPLSRARCCRPCASKASDRDEDGETILERMKEDADLRKLLNKDETDVRVLSENCERGSLGSGGGNTGGEESGDEATDKSLRASSSNAISALSNNEAKCPSGYFATAFEHAAEANPASTADIGDDLFFPTGAQTCCKPTILKTDDTKFLLQSCACGKNADGNGSDRSDASDDNDDKDKNKGDSTTSSVVSCPKNKFLRMFDHTIEASGSGKSNFAKPEMVVTSPFECCSMCINPTNGESEQPNCGKHGTSVVKDYGAYGCACDEGYFGETCELISDENGSFAMEDLLRDPSVAVSLMLIGVIFGCFARNVILARHQRFRRLNDALLHPLMVNGEHQQQRRPNDWDFEASDLSTSDDDDEDDEDDDGSDNDTESDDDDNNNNNNNNNNTNQNVGEGEEGDEENAIRPEDGPRTARRKKRNRKKKKRPVDQGLISASDNGEEDGGDGDGDEEALEANDGADVADLDDPHASLIRKAKGKKFSECALCLDAPVQAVLIPCGHACTCRKCCRRLRRCPICRVVIERRQKLYLGGS